mmetsp:Transcript_82103/g.158631  ORF Transcript_82103/g.158631 Transcript_82103/m.158631 type:complete len:278 (-) Transcript_82103:115-948(-)
MCWIPASSCSCSGAFVIMATVMTTTTITRTPRNVGPRAQLLSGGYLEVDLTGTLTSSQARVKIAAAQGLPIGCVRLLNESTGVPLEEDQAIPDDVKVVLLTLDHEVEPELLRAAGAVNMEELTAQQTLDLEFHRLTALPESFGQLLNLQMLQITDGPLSMLPESFGQLLALQSLNLRYNELGTLPESFGQLRALQSLELERNQLSTLPESFGQLSALQSLCLNRNKLSALPERICQLVALQSVKLTCNEVSTIPDCIGQLLASQSLELNDDELCLYF